MADPTSRIERLKAALNARHIAERDRARYLFGELGSTVSYWSGLLAGDRSFGEKAARRIEEGLSLPTNYLDEMEMSAEAMEIGELYDQLDAKGREVLRATAHALMRPIDGEPQAGADVLPLFPPNSPRGTRQKKLDA